LSWSEKSLAKYFDKDGKAIIEVIGDITKNWSDRASDRKTIAFSPSIKASKWLCEEFKGVGVEAYHIDGYMDSSEREELYQAHKCGEIQMLSCSQLLGVGYDEPEVSCLIDLYSINSIIQYVQRAGRIKRTFPGKEDGIYLDHAGNLERFGCFPEDIVPEELHKGDKAVKEKDLTKKQDPKEVEKEVTGKDCPKCYQEMKGLKCECGYEILLLNPIVHDGSDLKLIKSMGAAEKRNHIDSREEKSRFYGELLKHNSGKEKASGIAAHQYKARYGVWPNKINPDFSGEVRSSTLSWIKSQNIRRAKSSYNK
jgi:superfamily II DNA or RNA helicase